MKPHQKLCTITSMISWSYYDMSEISTALPTHRHLCSNIINHTPQNLKNYNKWSFDAGLSSCATLKADFHVSKLIDLIASHITPLTETTILSHRSMSSRLRYNRHVVETLRWTGQQHHVNIRRDVSHSLHHFCSPVFYKLFSFASFLDQPMQRHWSDTK